MRTFRPYTETLRREFQSSLREWEESVKRGQYSPTLSERVERDWTRYRWIAAKDAKEDQERRDATEARQAS